MRRLTRLPLSSSTGALLKKRTDLVAQASDPKAEATRLWSLQANKAFQEIRATLRQMASGIERCMYCEDSAGMAIEHFWPKATYPDRAFEWSNYLLACTICNSNFKRDQFPLDASGQPLLLNPAEEDPFDHLALSPSTGKFKGLSPKGDQSILVFALYRETLEKGRAFAWTALEELLANYAAFRQAGNSGRASKIEATVRNHPFAGVLAALVRIANGPDADLLIEAKCLSAIQQYPEILGWG